MKIGIDLDEVLSNTALPLQNFFKLKTGKHIPFNAIYTHDLTELWDCSPVKVQEYLLEFYDSSLFDSIKPLHGAQKSISILSNSFDLYIVTSRHYISQEKTFKWINNYFNDNINNIFFTGEFEGSGKTKADISLANDLSILIEDTLFHSIECSKNNIPAILFDKPWNQSISYPNIYRVGNWHQALEKIGKITNQKL